MHKAHNFFGGVFRAYRAFIVIVTHWRSKTKGRKCCLFTAKTYGLNNYRLMHSLNFLPYGISFSSTPIFKRQSASIYRHERSARRTIGRAKWREVQELLQEGATGPLGPHSQEPSECRLDTPRWPVGMSFS